MLAICSENVFHRMKNGNRIERTMLPNLEPYIHTNFRFRHHHHFSASARSIKNALKFKSISTIFAWLQMLNVKSNQIVDVNSLNSSSFGCFVYFRRGKEWMLWFSMGITQIDIEILFEFISSLPFGVPLIVCCTFWFTKKPINYIRTRITANKEFQSVLQRLFSHIVV